MDVFEKARQTCLSVTKYLINNKNGGPFAQPVDYVQLGIPHYPDIIKKPMDLGTVQVSSSTPDRMSSSPSHPPPRDAEKAGWWRIQ